MKRIAELLFVVSFFSCGAASAQNEVPPEGVEVSFVDNGGVIYKVKPPAFEEVTPYGTREQQGYVIPRSHQIRGTCFLRTPWLPVAHASGRTIAHPNFSVDWRGDLHPIQHPEETLLRFTLEVKRPDGMVQQLRSYVYTGLMTLQPLYSWPDGWFAYAGSYANPLPSGEEMSFGTLSISEGDEIRYNVCDAGSGVWGTIRSLAIHSYPIF